MLDDLMKKVRHATERDGIPRTIFAACPNSLTVIRAALRSAKRNNAPIKFAATLNQVDLDGGYTGLDQVQFVKTVRQEAKAVNFNGPVIIAVDHGGPWLKDIHTKERWSLERSMQAVKKSFEASVDAGYDMIHIDPTIDITLSNGQIIPIEVVASRTVELIVHTEDYRRSKNLPPIAYEVGTEEVHGGLADLRTFSRFLELLKQGLKDHQLDDVWPCFVVGKVGTDLHTTTFDPLVARELTKIVSEYGSFIKGHYTDNVSNPEEYPKSGIGAANVGPEFTEREYDGLIELCDIEEELFNLNIVVKKSGMKEQLWKAVIDSGRWTKWLQQGESSVDFYENHLERQEWLVKTCCRYIWENDHVLAARGKLYENLTSHSIDAEQIVLSRIENSMDKYFFKFNLVDLNSLVAQLHR